MSQLLNINTIFLLIIAGYPEIGGVFIIFSVLYELVKE